ncbi:MAG TPA: hypothetical protein VGB52_13440 [Actinomycetota bacterium]
METVLLVDDDQDERELLGGWLEQAGYVVEACPGPLEPDYVCVGGRTMTCPLAAGADVVVLDMQLGSDAAMEGTPGWHVLVTYVAMRKPVVALVSGEDPVHPRPDDQVTVLGRPPGEQELLAAVHAALGRRQETA